MQTAIVIPARMASTRFPGKPLHDLCGKPMIRWVYEAAVASRITGEVLVATPDQEIVDACAAFGAKAVLTSLTHQSGTDRIAEVAESCPADVFVNVQGDEPLIVPDNIAACVAPLWSDPCVAMASLQCPCQENEIENPAVVKVVTDDDGFALYFSRHAIPYSRNPRPAPVMKHIGLYAYRREAVLAFASWSPSSLEVSEGLEQLRFLQHGIRIKMSLGSASVVAVDTPEQADQARDLLAAKLSGL